MCTDNFCCFCFLCSRIVGSSYISSLREIVADEHIPVELGGACEDMTYEWPFPEQTGCSVATLSLPYSNELRYAAACELDKDSTAAAATTVGDDGDDDATDPTSPDLSVA
jgi:hypothetical protein